MILKRDKRNNEINNEENSCIVVRGSWRNGNGTVTAKADATVTVNAGDSLNGIAQKYNVSADDIATANHLQNKELIFAGQKLTIPTKDKNETPANNTEKKDQANKNSQNLQDSVNKAMSYLGTPYVWVVISQVDLIVLGWFNIATVFLNGRRMNNKL